MSEVTCIAAAKTFVGDLVSTKFIYLNHPVNAKIRFHLCDGVTFVLCFNTYSFLEILIIYSQKMIDN